MSTLPPQLIEKLLRAGLTVPEPLRTEEPRTEYEPPIDPRYLSGEYQIAAEETLERGGLVRICGQILAVR